MPSSLDLSALLTEQINPASKDLDALSTVDMLRVMNDEDQRVAKAVEAVLPQIAQAVDAIAEALAQGGHLYYMGAGTSGRLGVLDASECPPTYNVPQEMVQGIIAGGDGALRNAAEANEDSKEAGAADLRKHGFTAADVLCGIAASGRTPYVLGALEAANALGAVTIALACTPDSEIGREAKIAIEPIVGPEVVTGSTRMKAGTATKLVLNMLSTGTMVRLGYVYGNLMVNVQPKNEKLVDRAERIIMAVTGVTRPEAGRLLEESGRNVRTASVMGYLKLDRAAAEQHLAAHGGRLRDALGKGPRS